MNIKFKRMLSMLLVLMMVLSMVGPVTASASAYTAQYDKPIQIQVGERLLLQAPLWYARTTWSSSDKSVATVSQAGILTGIKAGEADITARSGKLLGFIGLERTTTYHVTVTETPEKVELHVGDRFQLTVPEKGGKTLWCSSAPKVAKVSSNGTVTALREGKATVTAKIMERSAWNWLRWYQSLEVEFQIIVTPVPTEPEVPTEPPVVTYTVTFESNGGSAVEAQKVEKGMTATEPVAPTLEGYSFSGWYTDAALTTAYDFSTPVTTDMTLYAAWITAVPKVVFHANCEDGSVTGMPEEQVLESGAYAQEPAEPTREGYVFAGWFTSPAPESLNDVFDFNTTPIVTEITLYAGWLSLADTDGDGLADGVEDHYGTDTNNPDTDGDGLSDYVEVVVLGSDPLRADSDGDNIADPDRDDDGDGITNGEEIAQGTNPGSDDTDSDLLTDDEELALGTDPLNYDTDGDGASDYTEVRLGTDPLTADASFDVVVDSAIEDTVAPSVEITLEGYQVDTLAIDPLIGDKFFPEDMPGYLGMAYNFSVDGEFDSATIRFEFDPAILENGADPAIFYFNEADQTLEELETTIEGNVASAVVNHFSVYVLIDRNIYYDSFTWEDVWDTEGTYDGVEIIMVIDDSGSLGGDYGYDSGTGYFTGGQDPKHQRLVAARNFVDQATSVAKIGIVKFDSTVEAFAGLTECDEAGKESLKSILQFTRKSSNTSGVFDSKGSTYMYGGIDTAFDLFTAADTASDRVLRVVIVFTDGNAHDASKHSSVIAEANNLGVRIYTVGLGSSTSYFTNYLQPLAEQTGGSFYMTSNADQLADIYNDISKKIDLEADADYDGIPDYYEDHMIAFNGKKIAMDKNKKDSDGDGLEDPEEVSVELVYNADRTKVYVKGKLNSYPDNIDSDNDSILDYHDPDPMSYTITDRVLSWVEGLSYTNLVGHVGKTLGQAINDGAKLDGINSEYAEFLKDAIIVAENDSGGKHWEDFFEDRGLGLVALKIVRRNDRPAVIFALRGTEPDDDLANDLLITDVKLGFSWSSKQSNVAFDTYKAVATNRTYDYYVTGHSLGGRLAQDVIYKTYNANEGGWFKEKANIIVPVHSVTFNALGYNKAVYATLENDLLKSYKNKLTNYYYFSDLIGEGLGCEGLFKRAGTDVKLKCRKINGDNWRTDDELNAWLYIRDIKYHGIAYFFSDFDLLYASTDKPADFTPGSEEYGSVLIGDFPYWVD